MNNSIIALPKAIIPNFAIRDARHSVNGILFVSRLEPERVRRELWDKMQEDLKPDCKMKQMSLPDLCII